MNQTRFSADAVILGVDPGGHWTGLCLRRGAKVLAHGVVERHLDETTLWERGVAVGPDYIRAVLDSIEALTAVAPAEPLVAVEAVVAPSPHVRRRDGNSYTNPTGALGAAAVFGAVLAWHPHVVFDVVVVPPGGHGSNPLYAYPNELVSAEESRSGLGHVGTGILRHARAAYDIAGAAPLYAAAAAAAQHPAQARTTEGTFR